jgi:protein-S-isoprenylcysteine O-methyltransferase Ste14
LTRKVAYARSLLSTAVLMVLLCVCAGRVNHPMLNAYIALFGISGLVIARMTAPALDQERRQPEDGGIDPDRRLLATVLFLTTVSTAALDSGRFHWTRTLTPKVVAVALGFVTVGITLQIWAMAVNPYFSTAVRLQSQNGHRPITQGPYRFLRHPGYLAMLLTIPATAPALGSLLGLIPALAYDLVITVRAAREDRFLVESLDGYAQYVSKVHYRLIPGLW